MTDLQHLPLIFYALYKPTRYLSSVEKLHPTKAPKLLPIYNKKEPNYSTKIIIQLHCHDHSLYKKTCPRKASYIILKINSLLKNGKGLQRYYIFFIYTRKK